MDKVKKIPYEMIAHKHKRRDDFYWMREKDHPDLLQFLENENAYVDKTLKEVEPLKEKIYQEIRSRIKEDDASVPIKKGSYYYYTRFDKGLEYPIYCRKLDNLDNPEEAILNVNELAKGHSFYEVGGLSLSLDHRYLIFCSDTTGRRIYDLNIKDLQTNQILDEKLTKVVPSLAWSNCGNYIFYTVQDETTLRPYQIYRHTFGSSQEEDVLIYEEKDETFRAYVDKTKTKDYLVISSHSTLTTEYQYLDANDPTGDFQVFLERQREHEYYVSHGKSCFYVLSNLEAPNFRLMKVGKIGLTIDQWEEVVPHSQDILLEDVDVFEKYFVLEEKKGGLSYIHIFNREDETDYYVSFKDESYITETIGGEEYEADFIKYEYESLTTPTITYEIDFQSRKSKVLKQKEVLGGFDQDLYETKRFFISSHDQVQVPMTLVYKKGIFLNRSNPTLVYGYGSYGHATEPYFRSSIISLLDRGFVYAIAHIRGGSEMGRYWYDEGKLLKKKNTFCDFIACSEALIEKGYTSREHLYAMGGSAGGLLVGAVMNMRPDLYHGIVAAVPFVDVVTTMLDDSIPLTTGEYDEWGNPHDKEYYDYILSYSPYDNVKDVSYPHLLVTTGYHDSQVQYWEPAKWVAKFRSLENNRSLVLFKTDMSSGHGGASGRFERLKEIALEFVFLLYLEGIKE